MKKKLLLALMAILTIVAAKADNDAVYAWINGQSTCYQLEQMPTVTYTTQGGTQYVNLTLDGKTEPELTLALETDADQLIITYGQYTSMSTKINKYGLTTFSCDKPVKFLTGAKPYVITADYSEYTLTVSPIEGDVVPAYNGVLLKGTVANAEVQYTILENDPNIILTNDLEATTTATGLATVPADGCYVLSGNSFGTYKGTTFTANKAYLPKSGNTQESRAFTIIWADEDTTTGIEEVSGSRFQDSGTTTVQQIGKYIYGGRLIIIKDGKQYDANGIKLN